MDGHKLDQDTSFSGVLKPVISPISDAIFRRSIYESSLSVGKRSRGLRSNDEWQGTFSGSTYNRKLASLLNLFSLLRSGSGTPIVVYAFFFVTSMIPKWIAGPIPAI